MIYVTCTHKYTDARPKESLGHLYVKIFWNISLELEYHYHHLLGRYYTMEATIRTWPTGHVDPSPKSILLTRLCAMQTHVVPLARYKYIVNYLGTLNVCRTQILPNVCAPDTKYDFTPSRNSST